MRRLLGLVLALVLLCGMAVRAETLELHTDSCTVSMATPAGWVADPGDAEHRVLRRGDHASLSVRLVESPDPVDVDGWVEDLRDRLREAGQRRPQVAFIDIQPPQPVSFQYGPARQFDMMTHMKGGAAPPWTRAVVLKVDAHAVLEIFLVCDSPPAIRQSTSVLTAMLQGIQVHR